MSHRLGILLPLLPLMARWWWEINDGVVEVHHTLHNDVLKAAVGLVDNQVGKASAVRVCTHSPSA